MCGICGFVSKERNISSSTLMRMNNTLRHRGPDDEGFVLLDDEGIRSYAGADSTGGIKAAYPLLPAGARSFAGLGFRRLSIIDLSDLGHQPMIDEDTGTVVTFNGEIYNYKALRGELMRAGYRFKSDSDTEVILKGYRHWGINVIGRLNGMFAIALLDYGRGKLWLVRDRMGIKPLFYFQGDHNLVWASEIKSILSAGVRASVNTEGLLTNYLMNATPAPQTCFREIWALPPAHYIEFSLHDDSLKEVRYWSLPGAVMNNSLTYPESVDHVQELLQAAVRRELVADTPVVTLMSGGIDSTTLTAMAANENPGIHSYTLGFDAGGKGADEIPQARAMAARLNIHQHIHLIRPEEITSSLLRDLEHFEAPYAGLEVVAAAASYVHRQGYKVALNGNGADELFGGYPYVLQLEKWQQRKWMQPFRHLVPAVSSFTRKVKAHLSAADVLQFFMNAMPGMRPHDVPALMPGMKPVVRDIFERYQVQEQSYPTAYQSLFFYDMHYSVAAHHVFRDDLSAMQHSMEFRYPFLDHQLVEAVARLPVAFRYNRKTNKPLLRDVAKRYITPDNLNMPKKGFALPGNQWMNSNPVILSFAQDHIERLKKRGIFNNKYIMQLWNNRTDAFTFYKVWQLVTTEVWLNKYIDRNIT